MGITHMLLFSWFSSNITVLIKTHLFIGPQKNEWLKSKFMGWVFGFRALVHIIARNVQVPIKQLG